MLKEFIIKNDAMHSEETVTANKIHKSVVISNNYSFLVVF